MRWPQRAMSLNHPVDSATRKQPCDNNIVDGSPAVWDALGLDQSVGMVDITWVDDIRFLCAIIIRPSYGYRVFGFIYLRT
jgi:hypothetical protein